MNLNLNHFHLDDKQEERKEKNLWTRTTVNDVNDVIFVVHPDRFISGKKRKQC